MFAKKTGVYSEETGHAGEVSVHALWQQLLSSGDTGKPSHSLEEKQWVHIDNTGHATEIAIDRHQLVHSLGLRYRDLAAVDPTLPMLTPSVILVRSRAIALNLDVGGHIRLLICENQVFVLSVPKAADPGDTALPTLDHPFVRRLCCCLNPGKNSSGELPNAAAAAAFMERKSHAGIGGNENGHEASDYLDVAMCYELRALEVALTAAVGILAAEVAAVEELAGPALDVLLRRVDRESLEAVRYVKNAIDRLQTRVQQLVTELLDLLQDDDDMQDLYLARRAEAQRLPPLPQPWERADEFDVPEWDNEEAAVEQDRKMKKRLQRRRRRRGQRQGAVSEAMHTPPRRSPSVPYLAEGGDVRHSPSAAYLAEGGAGRRSPSAPYLSGGGLQRQGSGGSTSLDDWSGNVEDSDEADAALMGEEERLLERDRSHIIAGVVHRVDPHEIEDAEDLLETMFERANMLLRRLTLLDERVDDTEDLLELDLDQRRNELVGLNLMVATVAMALGFVAAVGGVFGMNLSNSRLESKDWVLPVVLVATSLISILMLVGVVWYVRRRQLMFIPTLTAT